MRTRTLLTTPPGRTPEPELGRSSRPAERYSPGLALPTEPTVPSRFRRVGIAIATLVVVGLLGVAFVQVGITQQAEDPALTELPDE